MLKKISHVAHLRAHIYMHLSVLLWGLTGVLGRGISLREGALVWWRLLIVTITIGAHIAIIGKSFRIGRKKLIQMSAIGALLTIHWLLFYGAIKFSNISLTLSCLSTTSLFTALIEPAMYRRPVDFLQLMCSILGCVGVSLIFFDSSGYAFGMMLALLAAFTGSFFNILNKQVVTDLPAEIVSFYEMLGGLVTLTAFMPLYQYLTNDFSFFPLRGDWVLLIVLSVLCTHVTLVLSLASLKYLSAFTLNLAINLEPVYGIALAFLFYNEDKFLGAGFYAGSGLVLLSVVLHAIFSSRK
ncbi:MAG: DMT family transporter [Chitinophagales bacterium]|nr:DMT family transporter [Chitinophagales bacterium]MDW8273296.1 DMT family transporter [Chitinophagales bacterium]